MAKKSNTIDPRKLLAPGSWDDVDHWETLDTDACVDIIKLCRKAHEYSFMYGITGFAGAGKTTAFEKYIEDFENVIYLCLEQAYTPKDFYVRLLRKVGIHDYSYDLTLLALAEKFARVITARSERTLLIVDDSGRFRNSGYLTFFQNLFDNSRNKLGVILGGTKKFRSDLTKWVSQEYKNIPELDSRIAWWLTLEYPSASEKKQVAKANGVIDVDTLNEIAGTCSTLRQVFFFVKDLRIKAREFDGK